MCDKLNRYDVTQCAHAIVGAKLLDRCARDLPLPVNLL